MRSDRKKSLEHALGSSLDYLMSRQQSDGSWIDWNLPPGQSSVWTTAFVGSRLTSLPSKVKKRASISTRLASDWLNERIFLDGGWGYTEEVGSDADSTALAILFLTFEGKNIREASYACLQSFQCADGGFATFRGQPGLGSWGSSHTDVTPSAVLAMMTQHGTEKEAVDRGIEYIRKHKTSGGIWQSFWWTSFLYSTEGALSLLKAADLDIDLSATRTTLLQTRPQHPFESALLISGLLLLPDTVPDEAIWLLVDELLEGQECDGSWRSGPMLRVTRRDCLAPWKPGDPDPLFGDQNHLFTTATVVDAISKVYRLL